MPFMGTGHDYGDTLGVHHSGWQLLQHPWSAGAAMTDATCPSVSQQR